MIPTGARRARLATAIGAIVLCGLALGACGGSSSSKGTTGAAATATTPTGTTPTSPASGTQQTSTEPSPGVVRASSGSATATMHATTHHPRVDAHWPISFLVTRGGRPAKANVAYEYLFGGQVVAHRSHYTFTGSFHDVFLWPSSAVGYPLTFRAVIATGGATLNLDYPVQVVG
jgi:hypothetical protein